MANLTVFTDDDPEVVYPSQDVIWGHFEEAFKALWGLVTYAPVFREYYYRGLQEFFSDNVMYLELRVLLPEVRSRPHTVVTHWSDLLLLRLVLCCCSAVRVGWQQPRHDLDYEDLPGGHPPVQRPAPRLLWHKTDLFSPQVAAARYWCSTLAPAVSQMTDSSLTGVFDLNLKLFICLFHFFQTREQQYKKKEYTKSSKR